MSGALVCAHFLKDDKAEAARFAGVLVHHDDSLLHRAELREKIVETLCERATHKGSGSPCVAQRGGTLGVVSPCEVSHEMPPMKTFLQLQGQAYSQCGPRESAQKVRAGMLSGTPLSPPRRTKARYWPPLAAAAALRRSALSVLSRSVLGMSGHYLASSGRVEPLPLA